MRLLALGAALVLAYAYGRAREYRAWLTACETPTPQRETYDDVQTDPWPDLNPLTDRDRDWLDQTVRASLYPST